MQIPKLTEVILQSKNTMQYIMLWTTDVYKNIIPNTPQLTVRLTVVIHQHRLFHPGSLKPLQLIIGDGDD